MGTGEAIDGWTIIHFLVGLLSGAIGIKSPDWTMVAISWEMVEPFLVNTPIAEGYDETPANITCDIVVGIAGNAVGNLIRDWTR